MAEIKVVSSLKNCAIRSCEDLREFNILNALKLNLEKYVKKHEEQNTRDCCKQLLYLKTNNVCEELLEFDKLKFVETSNEKIVVDSFQTNIHGLFLIGKKMERGQSELIANMQKEMNRFFVHGARQSTFFDFDSIAIFDHQSPWIWERNALNSATLKFEEKPYYSDQIEFLSINFYGKSDTVESIQLDEDNFSYWLHYPNIKFIHLIESSCKKTALDSNTVKLYRKLQIILKSGIYSDDWVNILRNNPQLRLILFYNKYFKSFESILIKQKSHIDEYVNQGFGLEYRSHRIDSKDCSVQPPTSYSGETDAIAVNQSINECLNQTSSELNAQILHQNIIALRERLKKNEKCI